MARYEEPQEGEWVQPVAEGYRFQCCDCGLIHKLDFRVMRYGVEAEVDLDGPKYRVQFRAFRDNRATAAVRRERRKRGQQNP